jgi:hypothetical protein
MVSVEKYCTIARSGFIPCSLWYSYKYIVARNAGTYLSRFWKNYVPIILFSGTSNCFRHYRTGLYDATKPITKKEYIFIYFAAALDFKDHFSHQYRNQSLNCIVFLFGTWIATIQWLPFPKLLLGFSADSTTAKYFISNGTFFCKSFFKSNIQK